MKHISQNELLIADKLMAGIELPPRRYPQVLATASTAGKPFGHTGTSGQINVEVEEMEISAFSVAFQQKLRQLIVLLKQSGQILFTKGIIVLRLRHHRFHRNLLKAKVCQLFHILGEVQIVSGKGSPDKIILLISAVCRL